jgi:hypothetical protein
MPVNRSRSWRRRARLRGACDPSAHPLSSVLRPSFETGEGMSGSTASVILDVKNVTCETFDIAAASAAVNGPAAIGPLMLLVRDGSTVITQLCALKALALSNAPLSREALRRVRDLPPEHREPVVIALSAWSRQELASTWDVRTLLRSEFTMPVGGALLSEFNSVNDVRSDYIDSQHPEPWPEAEFSEGYLSEMESLTKEFGDSDWYEPAARPREPAIEGHPVS